MKFFKNQQRGITFVEMAVSIAVLSIILSSLVFYHRGFADRLEITNLAYDIALTIREAQVSGAAVKEAEVGLGFDYAFGIRFFVGNGGSDKEFISFVDLGDEGEGLPDGLYNGNFDCVDEECIRKIEIGRGNKISHICWRQDNFLLRCRKPGLTTPNNAPKGVDVTFIRPRLDATTKFLTYGGNEEEDGNAGREAVICLESPQGGKKTIHILPTGQISVGEENCDPPTPGFGP